MTQYRIADTVDLRLVGDRPVDRSIIERDTGLRPTTRMLPEADVVVTFCDRLALDGPLIRVGAAAAYAGRDFVVLPAGGRSGGRALLPFGSLDTGHVEVTVERDAAEVPCLVPLVNLAALGRQVLPLHAALLEVHGRGLLVVGWSKGGKTECVLAALRLARSCEVRVAGDEWVYLPDEVSRRAVGLPHPVRLWDWHLQQLPELRRRLRSRSRARLALTDAAVPLARRLPLARRVVPGLLDQAGVFVPLRELAGESYLPSLPVHAIVLVETADVEHPVTSTASAAEVVARMQSSLRHERRHLTALYDAFRFAFPGARSPLLEAADGMEARLLSARLDGLPAFRLVHPYRGALDALGGALERLAAGIETRTGNRAAPAGVA